MEVAKKKRNVITLELPKSLEERIREVAAANERTLSAQVRLILKQYLETYND